MSRLWSEIRKLSGLSNTPAPREAAPIEAPPSVGTRARAIFDRLRSHPRLVQSQAKFRQDTSRLWSEFKKLSIRVGERAGRAFGPIGTSPSIATRTRALFGRVRAHPRVVEAQAKLQQDASRLWSELKRVSVPSKEPVSRNSVPVATSVPIKTDAGTRFDRLRSHRDLLEVWTDTPTEERVRFLAVTNGESRVVGEMPRGLSSFLINLGEATAESASIEWHSFGSAARRTVFAAGEPLLPQLTCGSRIRLRLQAQDFPRVRIVGLRWVRDGLIARSVGLGPPRVADSGLGLWAVPDEWLGPDPVELRLTPVADDRQGLTERVILPPRRIRVETVFQRVMLPVHGRLWRRLRVEVRVPPPLTPPSVIYVDWQPYDSGVAPATFRRDWPPGATSVAVNLENISLRGDRVRVRIEPSDDGDQPYAWFAADESGYGTPRPDVLLAEGRGPDYQQFEFKHANIFPSGERANILSGQEPLPSVPGLETRSASEHASGWPASVLEMYRDIAADGPLWTELRRLQGAVDEGPGEFARVPQYYLQYANEPALRAINRRCGTGQSFFFVDQMAHAWAEQHDHHDDPALVAHWASAGDAELDRWLEAVAGGASIARLKTFWFHQRWSNVGVRTVLECSYHLDRVSSHPLTALVPEVIATSFMAGELSRAIRQEGRLPAVSSEEFAGIVLLRETLLAALADHWAWLLPPDADDHCRRIGAHLRTEPATAARELAELRRQPNTTQLKHGPWPMFEAERELAQGDLQWRNERELRLRTAADWCRTLLERRVLPAWPWYGLLPDGQDAGSLFALWEVVRPKLPDASLDSSPPPAPLLDALTGLDAMAAEVGDARLIALAAGLRENGKALGIWTQ